MPQDVHPQIQALIDKMAELGIPKLQSLSVKDARKLMEDLSTARLEDYPAPDVTQVEDADTGAKHGNVPVRIYRTSQDSNAPVIVFFHGGGHIFGSIESYDTSARFLALAARCTLVSVEYRLAPEHPFPAAVDDCYRASLWLAENAKKLGIDPARIALCGDSAGGNLAAVIALMARDSGAIPVSAQVLIYPVIDYRGGTGSFDRYRKGYGVLESDTVAWMKDCYLPKPAMRDDWRACPRNAASHEGLPPALVIAAQCDVLRDEVRDYAEQLRKADVKVEYCEFEGMTHRFFSYLGMVDDAERANRLVASFLKDIWEPSSKH